MHLATLAFLLQPQPTALISSEFYPCSILNKETAIMHIHTHTHTHTHTIRR